MKIKHAIFAAAFAATSLLTGALAFAPAPVYAEEEKTEEQKPAIQLQLAPISNRVTLTPGTAQEYSFNVSNTGSEQFVYNVYAAPYSFVDETYDINFSTETNRTQVSRWIEFKNADGEWADSATFTLASGEKQVVSYRIVVPEDIPDGGQYAAIFAETDPSAGKELTGSGIQTVSRAGLVIYGRTSGDTRDEAVISDYDFHTLLTHGNVNTGARVTNNGNTDFEAKYSLTIKTVFGKTVYDRSNSYSVLPETTRKISLEWAETPSFGIFKATARVSALDQVVEKTKIVMIVPLFVIIIMLLLLTILIVWTIILIKKRNEQKSKLIV